MVMVMGMELSWKKRSRTLRGLREGWKLPDLDFADDVTLLKSGERHATEALSRLERSSEEVGLVVSTEKTKAMPIGKADASVVDDGCPINQEVLLYGVPFYTNQLNSGGDQLSGW